jgi:hypothetical protein
MQNTICCLVVAAALVGCSGQQQQQSSVKKLKTGDEFSGFLKDYSQLKPKPGLDSDFLVYVNPDEAKHLRRYIAIVVDPVEAYLKTDAGESEISKTSTEAAAAYFRGSLIRAVSDAFPVVEAPGPLTLRLRAAIVGIDSAQQAGEPAAAQGAPAPLAHGIKVDEVAVELELVDSESGERIAAAVDKARLGKDVETVSRAERRRAAMEAFDGWADRVRAFLDSEHELAGPAAERATKSYVPY